MKPLHLIWLQGIFVVAGIFYYVSPILPFEIVFPIDGIIITAIIFGCLSITSIIRYLIWGNLDTTIKKIIIINTVVVFIICISILVLEQSAIRDLIIAPLTLFLIIIWSVTDSKFSKKYFMR